MSHPQPPADQNEPVHQQPPSVNTPPSGPGLQPAAGYLPAAPPPKKGMSTGKILLLVLGGFVALCCIGGIVAMATGATKTRTTGSAANGTVVAGPTVTGAPAAPATTGNGHAKLNQPVRDGKFEFTITKVTCGIPSVGRDPLVKTAQGQYCQVAVTVKNISNQPQTFDGSSQHAVGAAGAKYDHDGTAEIYANNQAQTFLEKINPGNSVSGVLVFDIPKDGKVVSLELHDSPFSRGVTVDVA